MNEIIRANKFFELWEKACNQRKEILINDWSNAPVFTAHVLSELSPIIKDVADGFNLQYYCGYYSIDAILFKEKEDRVPDLPAGTTWVRRIRIAFEHENYFDSGLFQEVSHLLITDCDLRVVVSYPNNEDALKSQLEYLHRIIVETDRSDQVAEAESFLFIVGWRDIEKRTIEWWGHIYDRNDWRRLQQPIPVS